ncbi:centromere protein M-like [Pelobates fuscus]|uniref:centromere protein M-like n=1 Tax=Pelobates fuscus TaxID=191477 RepID=UPI002FE4F7B0
MSELRPFDKLPLLNTAGVLLLGSEEGCRERVARALLQAPKPFQVKIHMAPGLPLPPEGEHRRPRFDLVLVLVSLDSQASLTAARASLPRLDPHYFLGKLCFLALGAARPHMVERSAVRKLADTHRSPLLFVQLDRPEDMDCAAQRLVNMLQVSAGLLPGISALYVGSLLQSSLSWD